MESVKRHPRSRRQAVIAALLVALVLMLDAMVASPALHKLVHADADAAQHQCVVTLFAHGQVDVAMVAVDIAIPTPTVTTVPQFLISIFSPAIEHLPAGRAPPVSVASLA